MKKSRKLGPKCLTLLMALAIVFATIPVGIMTGTVDTANAAIKGTLKQINLTNYALKSNKYMQIVLANYQEEKTTNIKTKKERITEFITDTVFVEEIKVYGYFLNVLMVFGIKEHSCLTKGVDFQSSSIEKQ